MPHGATRKPRLSIHRSAGKGCSAKFPSPRAVHRRFIAARYGIGRVGLVLEHPPLLSRVARWFPWTYPFLIPLFTEVRGRVILRSSPNKYSPKFGDQAKLLGQDE